MVGTSSIQRELRNKYKILAKKLAMKRLHERPSRIKDDSPNIKMDLGQTE